MLKMKCANVVLAFEKYGWNRHMYVSRNQATAQHLTIGVMLLR